ncbi:MAG: NAD-dependent epimerase/dehydratase family protein [Rhodospirillales bacterium]|nr:NAD-dependent epimerase/dehydratase family protein [Rhodospirillales bacterium]
MATAAPTLLTGATGFVGSAVARALIARGHRLRVLVRPSSDRANIAGLDAEPVLGDLTEPASLTRAAAGCRYVVHVAADYRIWVPDPAAMLRANIDGTVAMLRAAAASGAERIVYCSSVAALGLTGDGTPADEATPIDPDTIVSTYKQSKYQAERAARGLAREGVPVVIVNPAAPVGPRDIKPTPTGRMILDAAAGRTPAYVDTGLNVVHVDDVAEGHLLALERGRVGESYILGGENLSLQALLALVAEAAGRAPPRIRLPIGAVWPAALAMEVGARLFGIEPRVTRDYLRMARKKMFYSSAKAEAELGYAPRPVRAAIADALAWFRATGRLAGPAPRRAA